MRREDEILLDRFGSYLGLERGLSVNTLSAYTTDVRHLLDWLEQEGIAVEYVEEGDLHTFLAMLRDFGLCARSQSRVLAGVRGFFKFLRMEGVRESDPSALIDPPGMGRTLPDVLSVEEIDAMIAAIPQEKAEALRNRTIIETLYGSGLRVSELVDARLSHLNLDEGVLLVEGKGSKQRIVPLSGVCVRLMERYIAEDRAALDIKPGSSDIIFLNRRGRRLTRVMVFYIIRDLAALAGIPRKVSPHTLRHSFATHLLEGGASLASIRAMLGHESIATTEIYVHLDRTRLREELLTHHPHFSHLNSDTL
ncbi:MAG: tyrosine recombinase XerD [Muribaculaceae bacterium]|nr:tyrosine recombinase XerD [Muribaculaceae bacterium]